MKAYCPEKTVGLNPILEYAKYIIFEKVKKMKIERDRKFGGDVIINSYPELEKLYKSGNLHPADLKNSVFIYLNDLIEPVRKHFNKNKKARELYEKVKKYNITR